MRRIRTILILFVTIILTMSFIASLSEAETPLIGFVSQDTTWTNAKSPYVAKGNIIVKEGVTLTIEPGVTVQFGQGFKLTIEGGLIAKGTDKEGIKFTPKEEKNPGAWGGILFEGSSIDAKFDDAGNYVSGSILQYCTVEFAETGVKAKSASPFIDHCMIRKNSDRGINISSKGNIFFILNNIIMDNAGGIKVYVENGTVIINGNTLRKNTVSDGNVYGGGICIKSGKVTISNNTLTENAAVTEYHKASLGGGIYVKSDKVTMNNNILIGNMAENKHTNYQGAHVAGGGIYVESSKVFINNNTLIKNTTKGRDGDGSGIYLLCRGQATISNNTLTGNRTYLGKAKGGGIYVQGGQAIISDNTLTRNTINGSGGGIYVEGEAIISNNILTRNSSSSGGCINANGPVTIRRNTITKNYGESALFYSGSQEISENIIAHNVAEGGGNTDAVYIYGNPIFTRNAVIGNRTKYKLCYGESKDSPNLNAINNYWGLTTEGEIRVKIYDRFVSDDLAVVDVVPFLSNGPLLKMAEKILDSARELLQQRKPSLALTKLQAVAKIGVLQDSEEQKAEGLFIKALNELLESDLDNFREGMEAFRDQSRKTAFVSDWNGNREIYVMDSTKRNLINLTRDPADEYAPDYSPDGTKIVFVSNRQPSGIYLINADGSELRFLTDGGYPSWFPDGSRIIFTKPVTYVRKGIVTRKENLQRIFTMKPDGTDIRQISPDPSTERVGDLNYYLKQHFVKPVVSPDASKIAFAIGKPESGWGYHVYQMNIDGTGLWSFWRKLVERDGGDDQSWSDRVMIFKGYPKLYHSNNPAVKYLYGVYLWHFGSKRRARAILNDVKSEYSGLGLEFVSSPIPSGHYPVNLSKSGDFGWGTFVFSIGSIDVPDSKTMIVNVTVRNPTEDKQYFIFARAPDENFYIIDDINNTFFARQPYFVGARGRKRFNSSNDAVILDPGQEISESLVFPMVTIGSTSITFVSPRHDGHQWPIKFKDIILRKIHFRKFPLN